MFYLALELCRILWGRRCYTLVHEIYILCNVGCNSHLQSYIFSTEKAGLHFEDCWRWTIISSWSIWCNWGLKIPWHFNCTVSRANYAPTMLFISFSQDTIHDAIEDSITWPVRKIIPIIPGDYRYIDSTYLSSFVKFYGYISILIHLYDGWFMAKWSRIETSWNIGSKACPSKKFDKQRSHREIWSLRQVVHTTFTWQN